ASAQDSLQSCDRRSRRDHIAADRDVAYGSAVAREAYLHRTELAGDRDGAVEIGTRQALREPPRLVEGRRRRRNARRAAHAEALRVAACDARREIVERERAA